MPLTRPARLRGALRAMSFRTRIAAAFAALFVLAGVVLLAFVVVLARYGTAQQVQGIDLVRGTGGPTGAAPYATTSPLRPTGPATAGRTGNAGGGAEPDGIAVQLVDRTVTAVQNAALQQMLLWSGVGLVLITLLASFVGWWLAGRALRPVIAVTDTARRISEQNLHERLALTGPDDELHKLADTFDIMLDRLEKAFDSQRRFVSNASHELRTPLAAQRTSLQVGLADPLPDGLAEVREDLLSVNREAEQLIDSLLLLARSDRGLQQTEQVELSTLARQLLEGLGPAARARDVSVTLTVDQLLRVEGDPVLLRQLLTNLLDNALRYNRPGGTVTVHLTERVLTVANTGGTVAQEQVADLFEPFRRLGQDRIGSTGHGLGLSIARSIAEAHGADITADPGPDGGLTVAVTFRAT
ncbi:sensor histidine kinase [Streptacidiphilus sp. N1-3]|uniref:histidine kinase n=1 Tax=Streptacidiphilus alkalitolerans TaxID=3342712 RepID=A0ABV6X2I5_9ACTN